jgi:hypothetical protein
VTDGLRLEDAHPHICWPVQRLILEHVATRRDLEECYSVDDVIAENEALDAWHEAQRASQKKG